MGNNSFVARFIDLDTYVQRNNLPAINFIKLDIEGAEMDCLRGAAKSIVRWKPKLAISAYHKTEDMWQIAQYLKSLRSDYIFVFRHYKTDYREGTPLEVWQEDLRKLGVDYLVPTGSEWVLYCR